MLCSPIIVFGIWRYKRIYIMLQIKGALSNISLLEHAKEVIFEIPWLICLFLTSALGP